MKLVIWLQALTFVVAAALFYARGEWRLGTAQALLAVITALVYL